MLNESGVEQPALKQIEWEPQQLVQWPERAAKWFWLLKLVVRLMGAQHLGVFGKDMRMREIVMRWDDWKEPMLRPWFVWWL